MSERCYDEPGLRDPDGAPAHIPGCWPCVIQGDHDACTCEGSPNAIAMERRWRAYQRLQRMRERRFPGARIPLIALPFDEPQGRGPNVVDLDRRPEYEAPRPLRGA